MKSKKLQFTHLHNHSDYSLLDGLSKIPAMVKKAKDMGMDSIALTDHGNMYGAIELYKEATKQDIKPIIGMEAYITNNDMTDKTPESDDKRYHLILLAETNEGYKNLIQLSTLSHLEGFYYKPRIDKKTLKKYSKGIIALSACLGGEVGRSVLGGNIEQTKKIIKEYKNIFGDKNYFLEVQHNVADREQKILNEGLFKISKETKTPIVATADSHYLNTEDEEIHEILLAIQTGSTVNDPRRMSLKHLNLSLASAEEMAQAFPNHPEAIENSHKIAKRCNVQIKMDDYQLPHYEVPKSHTITSFLRKECVQGLKTRYGIDIKDIKNFKKRNHPSIQKTHRTRARDSKKT